MYRAGERVSEAVPPLDPEYEGSFPLEAARGAGSSGAFAGMAAAGRGAGVGAAAMRGRKLGPAGQRAAQFGPAAGMAMSSGMAETYETVRHLAEKHPEQATATGAPLDHP